MIAKKQMKLEKKKVPTTRTVLLGVQAIVENKNQINH